MILVDLHKLEVLRAKWEEIESSKLCMVSLELDFVKFNLMLSRDTSNCSILPSRMGSLASKCRANSRRKIIPKTTSLREF